MVLPFSPWRIPKNSSVKMPVFLCPSQIFCLLIQNFVRAAKVPLWMPRLRRAA